MVAHGFSGQSALAIFTAVPVFLIKINLKHLYRTIAQLYPVLVKVCDYSRANGCDGENDIGRA